MRTLFKLTLVIFLLYFGFFFSTNRLLSNFNRQNVVQAAAVQPAAALGPCERHTHLVGAATRIPTQAPAIPTQTPVPPTLVPPTDTPVPPTETPVPPTATSVPPSDTPVPPTNTPIPSTPTIELCYTPVELGGCDFSAQTNPHA
jgi:hypothetical protein